MSEEPTGKPLKVLRVVETGIYVADLKTAERFYTEVVGLEFDSRVEGRHSFLKAGDSMLLLFKPEASLNEAKLPAHGAKGVQHFAFLVNREDLPDWRSRLAAKDVTIETEVDWPTGGHSIYFRDPEQNSVELVTPGVWPVEK